MSERDRSHCQGCARSFCVEFDLDEDEDDEDGPEIAFCPFCGDEIRS